MQLTTVHDTLQRDMRDIVTYLMSRGTLYKNSIFSVYVLYAHELYASLYHRHTFMPGQDATVWVHCTFYYICAVWVGVPTTLCAWW